MMEVNLMVYIFIYYVYFGSLNVFIFKRISQDLNCLTRVTINIIYFTNLTTTYLNVFVSVNVLYFFVYYQYVFYYHVLYGLLT